MIGTVCNTFSEKNKFMFPGCQFQINGYLIFSLSFEKQAHKSELSVIL